MLSPAPPTLGLDSVTHQIVKPPVAWKGTPAEKLLDLDALTERTIFFTGTAREAASQYPQNANATVVTSLAGIGLDKHRGSNWWRIPATRLNGHIITAQGGFGRMSIRAREQPAARPTRNPRN